MGYAVQRHDGSEETLVKFRLLHGWRYSADTNVVRWGDVHPIHLSGRWKAHRTAVVHQPRRHKRQSCDHRGRGLPEPFAFAGPDTGRDDLHVQEAGFISHDRLDQRAEPWCAKERDHGSACGPTDLGAGRVRHRLSRARPELTGWKL